MIGDNCVIEENASVRKASFSTTPSSVRSASSAARSSGSAACSSSTWSIYEGSVISDDCRIGGGVEIAAGMRVWPDKYIEQGTRLAEDIIWGQREKKTLFGAEGIVGTFNVKITPEFASKLGSAIGAFLGKDAKITVSRDTTSASRLIMRAFTAGLLSMGVDVFDMEIESVPVNRYTTRFLNADMGAYIQIAPLTELQFIQITALRQARVPDIPRTTRKKSRTYSSAATIPRKEAFETGQARVPEPPRRIIHPQRTLLHRRRAAAVPESGRSSSTASTERPPTSSPSS